MDRLLQAWHRALARRVVNGECWEYPTKLTKRPTIWVEGKPVQVSRVSAQLWLADFTPSLQVCHRCDNPRCFRPLHLFMGTQKKNIADAVAKGRMAKQVLTHCVKGHEFTPENTRLAIVKGALNRICKLCRKAHNDARPRKTSQKRNRRSKAYYAAARGNR